jgi:hypothetical protein
MGRNVDIRERGLHPIEKRIEAFGTYHRLSAFLNHGVRRENLLYGFSTPFVPHFFEPPLC